MLRAERDGEIAVLTIARPRAHNALDAATLEALERAVKEPARAIVITGEGAFSSGGDLRELRDRSSEEDAAWLADVGARTMDAIEEAEAIVIAAIDGVAYGGGAELAMACDVRVMGSGGRLAFKQARMGATTAWGTSARLLRAVGHGAASLLLLTGVEIDATRATELGLIQARGESAKEIALELAKETLLCGPNAVRELKALLRAGGDRASERAAFVRTWSSAEHAAAVARFFTRKW